MANHSTVEALKEGRFSYVVADKTIEVELPPEVKALPEWILQGLHFALKTAARNETAGKMKDKVAEAQAAVERRLGEWAKGLWRTVTVASGEAKESSAGLLARAVAEALGISPEDAAAEISALVEAALDEAKIDSGDETPESKKAAAKIGADVRKTLREDPAVFPIYTRIQAEDAAKRAEAAKTATTGESKLSTLLKRG